MKGLVGMLVKIGDSPNVKQFHMKQTLTQQLLEDIIRKEKCSIAEAWVIYRRKYEDKELDPKVTN